MLLRRLEVALRNVLKYHLSFRPVNPADTLDFALTASAQRKKQNAVFCRFDDFAQARP